MKYKLKMVKGATMERLNENRKLAGSNFLIHLDSTTANRYRKEAKTKGLDANKYLAQILTNKK